MFIRVGAHIVDVLSVGEVRLWQTVWKNWLDLSGGAVGERPIAPDDAPRVRVLAKLVNGLPPDPEEERILDHWGHSELSYQRCVDDLAQRAPECMVLKGLSLSRLYPEGWTRVSGDLDLYTSRREDLWAACDVLQEHGYRPESAVALSLEDGPGLGFTFLRSCPECGGKLEVGLLEIGFLGDPLGVAPRRSLPLADESPQSVQIVPLLWEAFERPFNLRDIFDVWLVAEKLSHSADVLWEPVDEVGLWPEYQKLLTLGAELEAPVPPAPRDLSTRVDLEVQARRQRGRQVRRGRAWWAYAGGRKALGIQNEVLRQAASGVIRRVCRPAEVFAAGLPVCGARLDSTAADLSFATEQGRVAAYTPLGRFEFTHVPDLVI